MTLPLILIVVVLVVALAALAWVHLSDSRRRPARSTSSNGGRRRILFPFVAYALSQQALDAALRLCAAEDATLVPVFLARVSLHLPLDTPSPVSRRSRSRSRRRSSTGRRSSASPSTPGSSAAAPTATPCGSRSTTSASTGSSSPPPSTAAPASTPTTSPGCSRTLRARSSSCAPTRTSTSDRRRPGAHAGPGDRACGRGREHAKGPAPPPSRDAIEPAQGSCDREARPGTRQLGIAHLHHSHTSQRTA